MSKRVVGDEGVSSVQAWLQAARRATRTHNKINLGALMPLLVHYFAAGGSTSGVEQSFSAGQKLYDHLQLLPHVNDVMEAAVLVG